MHRQPSDRGFPSLARMVQESLKRDPHAGDLYVFRGRRNDLIKVIWWMARERACSQNDWNGVAFYGRHWLLGRSRSVSRILSSLRNRLAHTSRNLAAESGGIICD
jgi:hypothetical protein